MSSEFAFSSLKPRRRSRWLWPVIGLCALLLLSGAGYRCWISTPQYSLLQAKSAFESHDLGRFEKYVALDACADSLTDDVFAEVTHKMQEAPAELNPFGVVGRTMAQGFLGLFKPTLSSAIKQSARAFVSTGRLSVLPGSAGGSSINVGQIKDNLAKRGVHFEGIGDVAVKGETATVDLIFQNQQQARELPVQLEMRRVEGYWQVSKWKNSTAWIQKELPTLGR